MPETSMTLTEVCQAIAEGKQLEFREASDYYGTNWKQFDPAKNTIGNRGRRFRLKVVEPPKPTYEEVTVYFATFGTGSNFHLGREPYETLDALEKASKEASCWTGYQEAAYMKLVK